MTMPAHIRLHLEHQGILTPDGISRRAHTRYCRHCRRPVMTGLDHDHVAATATCDPTPLDALGELTALMNGRPTYELTWTRERGYVLDHRDQFRIRGRPAGTWRDGDVLAEHKCESQTTLSACDSNIEIPARNENTNDEPSF